MRVRCLRELSTVDHPRLGLCVQTRLSQESSSFQAVEPVDESISLRLRVISPSGRMEAPFPALAAWKASRGLIPALPSRDSFRGRHDGRRSTKATCGRIWRRLYPGWQCPHGLGDFRTLRPLRLYFCLPTSPILTPSCRDRGSFLLGNWSDLGLRPCLWNPRCGA